MLKAIRCTAKDLAAVLDLSERRISELTRAGVLRRPYDLARAVQGYLALLRSQPKNLTNERARLTKAQADFAELKLSEKAGELVRVAEVESATFAIVRRIRDNFLNLPPRTAGLVAAEPDQHKCFDILNTEVLQILTGLSHGLQHDRQVDARPESRPFAGGSAPIPPDPARGLRHRRRSD